MLTEYAITPQIFDCEHNINRPEWPGLLRSFCARLFGEGRDGTVISNLYDGSWYETEFRQSLTSACEGKPEIALLLKGITKELQHRMVLRPPANTNYYPLSEIDWISEINNSSRTAPICRTVASSSDFGVNNFFSLEEPFWTENQKTKMLPPDMRLQIKELERLLRFSSVIGFACPFFSQGLDGQTQKCIPHDESVFPIEIIKQKISLYNMITNLQRVDFHVEKPVSSYSTQKWIKEINDFLCSQIVGLDRVSVNIFLRDKITDRRIMFGDLKNNDFKLRWVVSSTHFPRPKTDDSRPIPTAFSDSQVLALLNKKDTSTCYSRYYD
jgi:hypothetical protein